MTAIEEPPAQDPECRSLFLQTPPISPVSADELEQIHLASMRVLEEIGMDFLEPRARKVMADAGAEVAGERVRLPRDLVAKAVASAPERFRMYAQSGAYCLEFGGNAVNFGSIASTPYCCDLKGGRRSGTLADLSDFVRLLDSLPEVKLICGYPVEPQDMPPETRHLDAIRAFLTLSDMPCHAYSLGETRIFDALEMIKRARGLDDAAFARRPSVFSIVNTSSPLRLDQPMAAGLMAMARAGQPVCVTPFTLSGAMSPVSLAGALVQQNAEALAVIALVQLVNPGAPVIYGGFTSNVDMRSGSPAFGTPEYARAALVGGQLARRYKLPYRTSNVNASNAVDAQAAYESMTSLWAAMLAHGNLIMHGAGWLEGGLTSSFEKVVLDAEMYRTLESTLTPTPYETWRPDPQEIAHLTAATEALTETACLPLEEAYAQWHPEPAVERASREAQRLIAEHGPTTLAPERLEALDAFIARRREEGGAEAA